jgi:ankyrin repeat protein
VSAVESLDLALRNRDLAQVKALIAAEPALAGAALQGGVSALMLAVNYGFSEAVDALWEAHPGPTLGDSVAVGYLPLLAAGADPARRSNNEAANQPLHAALAGQRSPLLVHAFLEAGAHVNGKAAGGVTPLHLAAARGDDELASILRAHGADMAARLESGQTPGELASERGHNDMARSWQPLV